MSISKVLEMVLMCVSIACPITLVILFLLSVPWHIDFPPPIDWRYVIERIWKRIYPGN